MASRRVDGVTGELREPSLVMYLAAAGCAARRLRVRAGVGTSTYVAVAREQTSSAGVRLRLACLLVCLKDASSVSISILARSTDETAGST